MGRVSVIIPCYAQAHFLADAIESVLAQTHRAHQIIVVDDGSPDDVTAVTSRYPVVQCHRQANRGLASARNAGLELATGDFVVFLDADDRLLPPALEAGAAALASHPDCAFVWGYNRPIDAAGRRLPSEPNQFRGGASYRQLLQQNVVGPPVAVMFQRAILAAVGGFSSRLAFAEDYEMYLRLAREHRSYCHEQVIAEYRLHDANMSSDHRGMLRGMLGALREQEQWVGGDDLLRRALAAGRRDARLQYDAEPRLDALRQNVRARRWGSAGAGALMLLIKHPRVFWRALTRRRRRVTVESKGVTTAPE